VFFAKYLLQRTREAGIDWDDDVPDSIRRDTRTYLSKKQASLKCYTEITKTAISTQLHGFSDSSEKGYTAVAYLRTHYSDSTVSMSLITAKSHVAPIKKETMYQFELSAALSFA